MNILKNNKRMYIAPQLECVKLDNEISLVLVSGNGGDDPGDPTSSLAPEYFNNNPYNSNLV